MKTLRADLAELMVQRHLISRDLADYHVLACPHCQGIGWRPVVLRGVSRFTRCTHNVPKSVPSIPDCKARAAGDR